MSGVAINVERWKQADTVLLDIGEFCNEFCNEFYNGLSVLAFQEVFSECIPEAVSEGSAATRLC
jgi:hypothetical protein